MNKMKSMLAITFGVLFSLTLFPVSLEAQTDGIKSIAAKEIWIIKNVGVAPFFSPDGQWVAWTNAVERETRVYVAKVGTEKIIELGKTEELLGWLPKNSEYLMTAEGFLSIKTKQISFLTAPVIESYFIKKAPSSNPGGNPYPTRIIYPFWMIRQGRIKKTYATEEPYCFSLLADKTSRKIVVFSKGIPLYEKEKAEMIFEFVPSPSADKFLLYYSPGENEQKVLEIKENKIHQLPDGTHFSWSPEGQKLIFAKLKDDGHFETSGELFLCNWDGTNITKIVFEKERIRRAPSFGPSDLITYNFYDENYTLCIGVAQIIISP